MYLSVYIYIYINISWATICQFILQDIKKLGSNIVDQCNTYIQVRASHSVRASGPAESFPCPARIQGDMGICHFLFPFLGKKRHSFSLQKMANS